MRIRTLIAVASAIVIMMGCGKEIEYDLTDISSGGRIVIGKPTQRPKLVEFWASWCGPCMASIDRLQSLHRRYGEKLEIVLVNSHESREVSELLWRSKQILCRMAVDEGGKLYSYFGEPALPFAILVDTKGTVVWSGNPYYLTTAKLDAFVSSGKFPRDPDVEIGQGVNIKVGLSRPDTESSTSMEVDETNVRWECQGVSLPDVVEDLVELKYAGETIYIVNVNVPFGPFIDLDIMVTDKDRNHDAGSYGLALICQLYNVEIYRIANSDTVVVDYSKHPSR